MTQKTVPDKNLAALRNVGRMVALIQRVQAREGELPGMACFYGPSGYGKSKAAIYATLKFRAITVQVKSVWTQKMLLGAILGEIGVPPEPTLGQMLDQICYHLATMDVPLLIDEADFLVKKKMIEVVRDIYEGSNAPVILIGEELLPQKLTAWERVHGRMLDWVAAQPGDMSDVSLLAAIYAPGLTLDAALRERLLVSSQGSIRRICVNLARVAEFAAVRGLGAVGLEDWGDQRFFTGAAPEIRK